MAQPQRGLRHRGELWRSAELLTRLSPRPRTASQLVDTWLGEDSEFVVTGVDVVSSDVSVAISGSGTHPEVDELAAMLHDELRRPITVTLRVSPVEVTVATSPPR